MIISEKLPQFEGETVLLAVLGRQYGVLYLASEGIIEKVHEINIPKPEYSDREGFFMRRGFGRVFGSGATQERNPEKQQQIMKFGKQVADDLVRIKRAVGVDRMFVFDPSHTIPADMGEWPAEIRKNVAMIFKGNYTDAHPFELLEKIQESMEGKVVEPISSEEEKILKKGRQ